MDPRDGHAMLGTERAGFLQHAIIATSSVREERSGPREAGVRGGMNARSGISR